MVYVTNRQGKALMPTDRHGKVRRLLKSGLAHVVCRIPFTIQLDYLPKDKYYNVNCEFHNYTPVNFEEIR